MVGVDPEYVEGRVGKAMNLAIDADDLERVYPSILYDFKALWADLKVFVAEHRCVPSNTITS